MKRSLGPKTLVFPTPAFVIATYDGRGRPNAATVAWSGICSSNPPAIAVSLRKATYTFGNIVEQRAFTVNVPSEEQVVAVDYFGIASGRTEDKFAASGLTARPSDRVNAPYIEEFPLVLECRLIHTFELGLHTQFVGEIVNVLADESVLGRNDVPDLEKIKPIAYAPEVRRYFGLGRVLGKAFSIGKEARKGRSG
jgi:flavin reductase (DIM6/NTAB) family NADH-FMN oxidoreductase RutF